MPLWVRATRTSTRFSFPGGTCFGWQESSPSLMVTGSHIADERNGFKFNRLNGEMLMEDEDGIRAQRGSVGAG